MAFAAESQGKSPCRDGKKCSPVSPSFPAIWSWRERWKGTGFIFSSQPIVPKTLLQREAERPRCFQALFTFDCCWKMLPSMFTAVSFAPASSPSPTWVICSLFHHDQHSHFPPVCDFQVKEVKLVLTDGPENCLLVLTDGTTLFSTVTSKGRVRDWFQLPPSAALQTSNPF